MNVQIVSFHCVLKNRMGTVISRTYNQDVITSNGSQSDMLAALALGLQNLRKGEKREIFLTAEQAYGYYDPKKVLHCHKSELPLNQPVRMGDQILLNQSEGQHGIYRVTQIVGDVVTLDSNHPLAGQDLIFEIEATAARDATPEEIEGSSEPMATQYLH